MWVRLMLALMCLAAAGSMSLATYTLLEMAVSRARECLQQGGRPVAGAFLLPHCQLPKEQSK